MIALIWVAVTLVLWGLLAWMQGSDPPEDGAVIPILAINAAIWPFVLAIGLVAMPFLLIAHVAAKHKAKPHDR